MANEKDKYIVWVAANPEHVALKSAESFREYYLVHEGKPYEGETNENLAVYGDAVLRLALTELLIEEGTENLEEEKKVYDADGPLVDIIARRYQFLNNLRYNIRSKTLKKNYDYEGDSHKYLANGIKACLGALYLEHKDFAEIKEIVALWKKLIDRKVKPVFGQLENAVRLIATTDEDLSVIAKKSNFKDEQDLAQNFEKYAGENLYEFIPNVKGKPMIHFYQLEDMLLTAKMPYISVLAENFKMVNLTVPQTRIYEPNDEYGRMFQEPAIIEHKGVIYAYWYVSGERELIGRTPIVGRRSYDGGKTWTDLEIVAEGQGKEVYTGIAFGESDGKLYFMVNSNIIPDCPHAFEMFVLNEETDKFESVYRKEIPFKPNTNVIKLSNGKLIVPGRLSEAIDQFPIIPAVMISDSGRMDGEWRIVRVKENGILPNGEKFLHPELALLPFDNELYVFIRNDYRRVPVMYVSKDYGETWSEISSNELPIVTSRVYGGELSNGRRYLIANVDDFTRRKLVVYFTDKDAKELKFTKCTLVRHAPVVEEDIDNCNYPSAYEYDGKLFIVAITSAYEGRAGTVYTIDLADLDKE